MRFFLKKIYSVIVAYYPDLEDLRTTIRVLYQQSDQVILCNNSDYDIALDEFPNLKTFNFGENRGIAYAQAVGMDWAFSEGADFILQLDQDSILMDGTVESLILSHNILTDLGYKVGAIGPRHFDKVTNEVDIKRLPKGKCIEGTSCEKVLHTLSSACLIPKQAFFTAGNMESSLFIDLVDWEYCWRLKKYGFLTFRDNSVLLPHRVGDGCQKIIGGIDARKPSPIRHYYHTRNLIFMLSRSYVPFSFKMKESCTLFFKLALYRFVFSDGNKRMRYLLKGVVDGFKGKSGKYSSY